MRYSGITIRNKFIPVSIFQGGMGIGVSCPSLSGATAREGGVGVLSSAGLSSIYSQRMRQKISIYESILKEITETREISKGNGAIGINIMHYLQRDFETSIRASIDAGIDIIIVGAGLPLTLPKIVGNADVALMPIISSLRALKIIHTRWQKQNRELDGVILEGPLAGGHLGFKYEDIQNKTFSLEKIFFPIKEFAKNNGDFPVIVAGGVYTHEDYVIWLSRGADAVQLGTRFLATHESGATESYKRAVVSCSESDIIVVQKDNAPPGSPSGMPFRTLKKTPMILHAANRNPVCTKGHVLQKNKITGKYDVCGAKDDPGRNFCICNGLLTSCGYGDSTEYELYTVGTNAARITEITSVKNLMNELKGH